MNDASSEEPVLSQDELEALLERLSDKGATSSWSGLTKKEAAPEARLVSLALQRASEVLPNAFHGACRTSFRPLSASP
jgi:hypothetical protein